MKKIVLAGIPDVSNLGDPVLFESTEYLIKLATENDPVLIERLDLIEGKKDNFKIVIIKVFNKIINMLGRRSSKNSGFFYKVQKQIIKLSVKDSYANKIQDADMIIFAGGGILKYRYETFDFRISILVELAQSIGIPIAFNAVGVEGYSEENLRCQELKKTLNSQNIKLITTRDDVELLNKKYITNSSVTIDRVADSAFWSDVVYNTSKNKESDTIGLGVARGKIFEDNGISVTEGQLLELWSQIISELDFRGLKWRLFTNGFGADNEFMDLLLKKIGRTDEADVLTVIPKTSKELVETIASFNKVIACRMHASIIAYSLEVPAIGLIWNDKIKMFGEIIGRPDRYLEHKDFEAKHIVDKILKTEFDTSDREFKNNFKKTTYNSLKRLINSIES